MKVIYQYIQQNKFILCKIIWYHTKCVGISSVMCDITVRYHIVLWYDILLKILHRVETTFDSAVVATIIWWNFNPSFGDPTEP